MNVQTTIAELHEWLHSLPETFVFIIDHGYLTFCRLNITCDGGGYIETFMGLYYIKVYENILSVEYKHPTIRNYIEVFTSVQDLKKFLYKDFFNCELKVENL